ncbi:carbon-nitrogen hydrolase family protein [Neobacillus mesonae]|uniref:carbon-nitrogen hydrolase family protein n=1 Tax=Neobacillus mesonae TaxID=1193713 RepID=UPI0020400522|nr:carbon-nitrogen hydrolase family protein [Neobacillus mesonae]MCM3571187.1 carbon-nitrogen hydrolase family protein [Neobacillus mesonae]
MSNIHIALAQLVCDDGDIESNLARMDRVINQYGFNHDLIIFPETYTMGFPERNVCRSLAQTLDGPVMKHLEQKAREANTTIAAGLYEKDGENVYNTTVLVGPNGLLLSYRKTHLWVGESARVESGNKFQACDWKNTRLGILICYDIEFPETARTIARLGTELLIVTDGNMAPYGPVHHVAIRARAQENQIFVAMTNRVGDGCDSSHFVGGSMIADPYGRVIVEASDNKEEVISASIDLSLVKQSRQYYHYLQEARINPMKQVIEFGQGKFKIDI